MNKHHLLLAPLILGISTEICAEDYFDPSLLASDVSGLLILTFLLFPARGEDWKESRRSVFTSTMSFIPGKPSLLKTPQIKDFCLNFPPVFLMT